jgi:hypothetical protein
VEDLRKFFRNFSELNHVKSWPEDWYRVSIKQVQLAGGFYFSLACFPSPVPCPLSLSLSPSSLQVVVFSVNMEISEKR